MIDVRTVLFALAMISLSACSVHHEPSLGTGRVPVADAGETLGEFHVTYYLVAQEKDHAGKRNTAIYDANCRALASVPKSFAKELTLEGTGRLRDGRMVNYAGRCSKGPTFRVLAASAPWGVGAGGANLVPFRSIATDPAVVPTGTRVYVPALDGMKMPGEQPWGGFVHDGCVDAVDTGGAIRGKHIDVFTGTKGAYHALDAALARTTLTLREAGDHCH